MILTVYCDQAWLLQVSLVSEKDLAPVSIPHPLIPVKSFSLKEEKNYRLTSLPWEM
jgi:hypothetical protein